MLIRATLVEKPLYPEEKTMNKHMIFMVIGCVLPLAFIFIAPIFGFSSTVTIFIVIVAMFLCHLLMPMHHGSNHEGHKGHDEK